MRNPQSEVSQRLLTEIFTGSGNRQDDARETALTRYLSWKVRLRNEGKIIEEKSTEYTYSQRNAVYCRCTLRVEYGFL
jgi:hypothetical protein